MPYNFEFDDHSCVIKYRKIGMTVVRGNKKDGLCYIADDNNKKFALYSNQFRCVNEEQWHARLGHPRI